MKTVLVTGASGFIGSYLVNYLANNGLRVKAVYRKHLSTIQPGYSNIETCLLPNFFNESKLDELVKGVEAIVHLAVLAHDTTFGKWKDEDYEKINSDFTKQLAKSAAGAKVKRFLFISTIKVLGEDTAPGISFNESTAPNPRDPYSKSKLNAEKSLKAVCANMDMEYVIVRPPLVYGPNVKGNLEKLANVANKRVFIPAPAVKNDKSLVSVQNLSDAILCCLKHPGASNETFLVSDGRDVSTLDLTRMITNCVNGNRFVIPIFGPFLTLAGLAGDLISAFTGKGFIDSNAIHKLRTSLKVDSSKIRQTLNWTPPQTIEEGIHDMVKAHNEGSA